VGLGPALAAQAAQTSAPLAQVNGEAITADEVERTLGAPLRRLEEQIYQLTRQKLEALIGGRLQSESGPKGR